MHRYRRTPEVIEAVQLLGRNRDALPAPWPAVKVISLTPWAGAPAEDAVVGAYLGTPRGLRRAPRGSWRVRDGSGSLRACPPSAFESDYEVAERQ